MKLAFEKFSNSDCFVKVYDSPPQIRTIEYSSLSEPYRKQYFRIAIPRLAFVEFKNPFINLKPSLYVFIASDVYSWEKHVMIPFPFFNTWGNGQICLDGMDPTIPLIDYFWHSSFTTVPIYNIPIDEDWGEISSVKQWEKLTKEHPDFMEKKFNPQHFAARSTRFFRIYEDHRGQLLIKCVDYSPSVQEVLPLTDWGLGQDGCIQAI